MSSILEQTPLGKKVVYQQDYNPELLMPIPRKLKRDDIGISDHLPFKGYDIWNGFELSWLNPKGKPVVALAEFIFPCDSPNIVESKTFKVYLNSFNATKFSSPDEVEKIMQKDLSLKTGGNVTVKIISVMEDKSSLIKNFSGTCLDHLDIECSTYTPDVNLLKLENETVKETIYSHLLKSNCLVTTQPDWGSLQITYSGRKINHDSLLRYIVSYRNHSGFAEHCVEKIFMDLMRYCKPEQLIVYGRYTRRGGLDINPVRSTEEYHPENIRLSRQ